MDVAAVVVAGIALALSIVGFFSKHRPFVLVMMWTQTKTGSRV